jgi:hypothetical protein
MLDPVEELEPWVVARAQEDPAEALRLDLEDTLKEYGEFDLLVELLQNAIDALDLHRFERITAAAERSPSDQGTIGGWNAAVLSLMSRDQDVYEAAAGSGFAVAQVQTAWMDRVQRRAHWWRELASQWTAAPDELEAAAAGAPQLRVRFRTGDAYWLEVEDNGVGMPGIVECFRHRSSHKRPGTERPRRYGVRGNHGWGLSAVLGLSDRIEVITRRINGTAEALIFSDFASFVRGEVAEPTAHRADPSTFESPRILAEGGHGTHIRVRLDAPTNRNLLGEALLNPGHEKFANLLRLYTPVGQVNDYLLHPAFHTLRAGDLSVELTSDDGTTSQTSSVDFDYFRLSGRTTPSHLAFPDYLNANSPRGKSVYAVFRARQAGHVLLVAADIQAAEEVHRLEKLLDDRGQLPAWVDENGSRMAHIPRGFQFALSGGLRSEYLARPPRGTSAAFRGIVLSETARPTLGRRHVMDQREAIPRGAALFESAFDDTRRAVLPSAEPPPTTPAAARWRREFFDGALAEVTAAEPALEPLVSAARESREARVMLLFAELLVRGFFGDVRILRVHLQDIYDFAYLQTVTATPDSVPAAARANELVVEGRAAKHGAIFTRYGIGEFKAAGEDLLDDLDPRIARKAPDTPDLLVCWSFERLAVEDRPWAVSDVDSSTAEIPDQTHTWLPSSSEVGRTRPLPVIALEQVVSTAHSAGTLDATRLVLPANYY